LLQRVLCLLSVCGRAGARVVVALSAAWTGLARSDEEPAAVGRRPGSGVVVQSPADVGRQ